MTSLREIEPGLARKPSKAQGRRRKEKEKWEVRIKKYKNVSIMNNRHDDIASALPADLDALPRLHGFRLRGMQMTRLETFIDAAFASSILISWAMIVTILIFIYPLKAIFGAMWYLLSSGQVGQPFSLHTTESQARTIFAIYALGLVAISTEILLLNLRAWQLREPLRLNALERLVTRGELTGWSVPVGVGIVALIFALTLPTEQIQWSGWVYFSMIILVPLHDFFHKRRLKAVQDGS